MSTKPTGPRGWIENRFQILEERLARLEEGELEQAEIESLEHSLEDEGFTVGRFRSLLARYDPRTPIRFEVEGNEFTECAVWTSHRTNAQLSTPLHQVSDTACLLRLEPKA